jgi:ABC-2 type transport system ATP-binding protein
VTSLFRAEGIGKAYRGRLVVDGVSFAPLPGEIFGLLGPNGSGKSTTLHICTGLVRATHGEVWIGERRIEDKASRHRFGFAPDDLPLPGSLTGWEYLAMHDSLRGRNDRDRAADLADALGISPALDALMSDYSHGMRRKIQLVAATMHQPDLLFLDEPFRGLDPEAAATLRELLALFTAQGGSVIVATHDMLRAERDCQRVLILHNGQVAAHGSPQDLCHSYAAPDIEAVFLSVTHPSEERRSRRELLHAAFARQAPHTPLDPQTRSIPASREKGALR